jgi:hypothetical protein
LEGECVYMKKETAKAIVDMSRSSRDRLCDLLEPVKEHGTEAEFNAYKLAISRVMADMLCEVLKFIFFQYPELEPEELKLEYINIPPLENPIAVRELWTRDEQGNKTSVTVLLASPVPSERFKKYDCHYQIRGRGNNRTHLRSGVDPMEALIKAIRAIGWELRLEREQNGKKIWWHDENDTLQDLGFPVPSGPHD